MRKFFFYLPFFVLMALVACDKNEEFSNGSEDGLTTRSASTVSIPLILEGSEYLNEGLEQGNFAGVYWKDTYTAGTNVKADPIFRFSHTAGNSGGYTFWSGMVISSVNDITNYSNGTTSSDTWVNNQWGCMAGDNGSEELDPYMVAFWGDPYTGKLITNATFTESAYTCWVALDPDSEGAFSSYKVNSLDVCFHPWAYYGVTVGDGFAAPLTQPGDFFKLIIYGVSGGKITNNYIEHYFAYKADGNKGEVVPSKDWESINVSNLGENITHLVFQMDGSDVTPAYDYNGVTYGPYLNTAAYFCLKNIQVTATYATAK